MTLSIREAAASPTTPRPGRMTTTAPRPAARSRAATSVDVGDRARHGADGRDADDRPGRRASCRWRGRRRLTCLGSSRASSSSRSTPSSVGATVGTGGGVNTLSGAQLTTLSLELDVSDITVGPVERRASGDPRRHQARGRRAQAGGAGGWCDPSPDTRAWIGVKATEVGTWLEGIDGLTLSIHRRQLRVQQRVRGARLQRRHRRRHDHQPPAR